MTDDNTFYQIVVLPELSLEYPDF